MKINNLKVSYGNNVVIDNLNLSIQDETITCILGPSGLGKTTLLNAIANNVEYTGFIDNNQSPSYVFQEDRLINSITIKKNLEFVMKVPDNEKIEKVLKDLNIYECLDKYPNELSGGQRTRVSIARAYLYGSKLMLLDEPFKDLDIQLKHQLLQSLLKLQKENKVTILYVTHNVDEALLVADRILVLNKKPVEIVLDEKIELDKNNRNLSHETLNRVRDLIYKDLILI